MKVKVNIAGGAVVEFECQGVKQLFERMTELSETVMEPACGCCGSEDITPRHRKADNYDFYELKCLKCGAALSFGQQREGGKLFPKRKLENGEWDNQHKGWKKYQKQEGKSQPKQTSLPTEDEVPF